MHVPDGPWAPETFSRSRDSSRRCRSSPGCEDDPFGQRFLVELREFLGRPRLVTDAPWFVRVRAWRPRAVDALVIHWINYRQDEEAAIEVPLPVGPLQAECEVPEGYRVERVEWRYPEMREPAVLAHQSSGSRVGFRIPILIVHGMSVLHLQDIRTESGHDD